MSGFILVGSGRWHDMGVMAETKRGGLCFGVRRASIATVFPTRLAAISALKKTNVRRTVEHFDAVTAQVVRLVPVKPKAKK